MESENIKVEYCPTRKMIADFFTKLLQGALFQKFRDIVLGYKHISELNKPDKRVRKMRTSKPLNQMTKTKPSSKRGFYEVV